MSKKRLVFWSVLKCTRVAGVAIALMLTGCMSNPAVLEFKLSYDSREVLGRQPTGHASVRQYFGREPVITKPRGFVEYEHLSSVPDGSPFNNRTEYTMDTYGLGVALPLWKAK